MIHDRKIELVPLSHSALMPIRRMDYDHVVLRGIASFVEAG